MFWALFRNPQPVQHVLKVCSTPPICTAVQPPFVTLFLAGFQALKKGKRRSTPPSCTAVRLPSVLAVCLRKYWSHTRFRGRLGLTRIAREPPDRGKQRRIRLLSRTSREFRDPRDSSSEKQDPFRNHPFFLGPDRKNAMTSWRLKNKHFRHHVM